MRLAYQVVGVFVGAALVPVVVIGIGAHRSMLRIGARAAEVASDSLLEAAKGRQEQATKRRAEAIGAFMAAYERGVAQLAGGWTDLRAAAAPPPVRAALHYGHGGAAGLPGYGYVHPAYGAYADWDRQGPESSPWLPRPGVERTRRDAAFRARVTAELDAVMALSPQLARVGRAHRETLDLAWIVLTSGVANVYPPYDYPEVVREDPSVLDLDESAEDYVRLLDPEHDPERATKWLEPYLDPFRGVWMTSCVAPLYEGERFVGTTGMDVLLPVVTEEVIGFEGIDRGWAFLLAGSGQLIAVAAAGVDAILTDPAQRAAFRETFRPPAEQQWTPEGRAALRAAVLDRSADPVIAALASAMRAGGAETREITLRGSPEVVSFAPVGHAGWSLGVVTPRGHVVAPSRAVAALIDQAAAGTARNFSLLAALLIAAGAAVGFLLDARAVRPLGMLAEQMRGIDLERLDPPPATRARADEIGQLETDFRRFLDTIRSQRNTLAAENELWLTTLRSIGDGVITTDAEARVTVLNPVAEALTGWSHEDAVGRPVSDVFRIRVGDPVRAVLASGTIVDLTSGAELIARDGTVRVIADIAAPIRVASGAVVGVVLVFRDVTERAALEAELARAQKLDSLRVLAAGIAHDFNNVLAAVIGNLSIARDALVPTDPVSIRLEAAERAAGRAGQLARQLTTFTTGGQPVRGVIALGPVLSDASEFATRGANVRVEVDVEPGLATVNADEGQIAQVVSNLVINAAEAMPHGGVVRVRARTVHLDAGSARPLAPGPYVEIAVSDDGPGIPPDVAPRVFDPFFTTKSRGSGLGLAVCYSIVRDHGGHIEMDSAPGGGTTARFFLPAVEAQAAAEPPPPVQPTRGDAFVLVMDDDVAVAEMLTAMLRRLGYGAEAVGDGAAAVTLWEARRGEGRPFDLVILDLTVRGGMGGEETLARLRALDPAVCAIASSGYTEASIVARCRDYGFCAALTKPYGITQLAATLTAVLQRDSMELLA